MGTKKSTVWIVVAIVAAVVIGLLVMGNTGSGAYDEFAQCMEDEGVIFFGAFWCPACQQQKTLFGKSEKVLPYTECSTPDGRGQNELCIQEGIEQYPTWEFADGERISGVLSLQTLSQKSGCSLP